MALFKASATKDSKDTKESATKSGKSRAKQKELGALRGERFGLSHHERLSRAKTGTFQNVE
jgi:hypothetical protein